VTLVYWDHTVGHIKMKLAMQVGLGPDHILLDRNSARPPQKGGTAPPNFLAHVYCGRTVAYLSNC